MDNKKITDYLDKILKLLHDGYSCYKSHIENVEDSSLKNLFADLCKQRQKMADEIANVIQTLGGKPSTSGTAIGTIHKFYENLKSLITQGDPLVITKEIKRGENMLLEEYKEALAQDFPENIKNILLQQLSQVEDELKKADLQAVRTVTN